MQVIPIHPSDVDTAGRCSFHRALTGLETGTFNVVASVMVPGPPHGAPGRGDDGHGPPPPTAPVGGAGKTEPGPPPPSGPGDTPQEPEWPPAPGPGAGPPIPGPAEAPSKLCGPDITDALKLTLQGIEARFNQLSDSEQENLCDTLRSMAAAENSWDVVDLHTPVWVNLTPYSPPCARPDPPCGNTVIVQGNCFKAPSVNCAAFGVMHRLCAERDIAAEEKVFRGILPYEEHQNKILDYWKSMSLDIQLWKGPVLSREGLLNLLNGRWPSAAPNYEGSRGWATIGYLGWHKARIPVPPSEVDCPSGCPVACTIKVFQVQWGAQGDFLEPLGFK